MGMRWERETLIFATNQRNYPISLIVDVIARYSVMVKDWETINYFLLFQEIRESPKKIQKLVKDLRYVGSLS